MEQIPGVDSVYGVLETRDGSRLRTILTRPVGTKERRPAIVFVQGLSCDSVELPATKTDGWSRMLRAIARGSGMVMLRTEKSGVGDSQGPACAEMGYDQELEHHRQAIDWLTTHPWVDPQRIVLFGASMGGTMAPLLAVNRNVAGVVVWGGGANTWLERTLEFERRYRERTGVAVDRLTADMKLISEFLPQYLIARRHPRDLRRSSQRALEAWRRLIGTNGDTHYGRSPIFHQQAQARDWIGAWAKIKAPVLALYGEYDWNESEAAHQLIVDTVARNGESARLTVVPATDHHFVRFPSPEAAATAEGGTIAEGPVVEEILSWLDAIMASDRSSAAAPRSSATLASFHRAEMLVRRALRAMGGVESLRKAGGITLVGRGRSDLTTRMQGMHDERAEWVSLSETLAIDLAGDRVAYETHARVNPDADEWIRFIHDNQGRMLLVLRLEGRAFWIPSNEDEKQRYLRIAPQLLLQDALDRRASLRYLGRDGNQDLVSFALASGEHVTLRIDTTTGLLYGFEYLLDMPLLGDTAIRWEYDDYRTVHKLGRYPAGYRIYRGTRLLQEVRYRTIRPGTKGAAVLRPPKGVKVPDPPPAPRASNEDKADVARDLPEVRKLSDGVYLAMSVRGGFHALFIEFEDFVVVVDAPAGYHELQMVPAIDWAGNVTSSSVGRRLLRAVGKTVPGKPVRYLVLTHHHGDHAGGVRPFLAAGATVLSSAPTRAAVERAARSLFRLEPDAFGRSPSPPRIEVVDGERTISDGKRSVRIVDVGPNPHAEGMLVVYLPEAHILYQSDLFIPSTNSFPDPARVPVMKWFVDWLDRSGLKPDRIYAIHGSAEVTADQLSKIRALK